MWTFQPPATQQAAICDSTSAAALLEQEILLTYTATKDSSAQHGYWAVSKGLGRLPRCHDSLLRCRYTNE